MQLVRNYLSNEKIAGPFVISFFLIFGTIYLAAGSWQLAFPISIITVALPIMLLKQRAAVQNRRRENLWPEILDILISGIQSGLSLTQTLMSLSVRGPEEVRPIFANFQKKIVEGSNFDSSLNFLKKEFSNSLSDQVIEVLRISQSSGSRDTSLTLRTIANFITSDISIREEIHAKHSWIRNSAVLAALTPWILLIILSTQEAARQSYNSSSGLLVLISGACITFLAFAWMQKVGKIENSPRIFIK